MFSPVRLVQLSIFLFSTHLVICKLEFTNIKCVTFDPEFAVFDYCFLKSVNRTYKYYSLKVKLLKTPVTNVKINIATFQRLNGYKLFLYNVTVDGCRFYKNQRSNPVFSYFFNFFIAYSNLNHSCPYDHDIILEKVSISHVTNVLPVPHGDYLYRADWYAYNIKRDTVDVFAKIY
ncbi:uncharacterized protein LOC6730566 [Drosophila simulans]|uniref:GD22915 n=1 Tax=Drosophila simulans TaxID=7240 RepID=B4Q739_DROSI|nr:uncharacterized protein LOC6730566 [Drosophila simulans]EDX03330.1 GD22915 [Drosophila simulans]KMY87463.1 uncharacterized protein Dsimw501_GD22915 [Drosophila simulans]